MTEDFFAGYTFGKIALQKIAPADPNFRLYLFGLMNEGSEKEVMKVSGAVFRVPVRGPNKGMLSIMVPKTSRTVYVSAAEVEIFDRAIAASAKPEQRGTITTMGFDALLRILESECEE